MKKLYAVICVGFLLLTGFQTAHAGNDSRGGWVAKESGGGLVGHDTSGGWVGSEGGGALVGHDTSDGWGS